MHQEAHVAAVAAAVEEDAGEAIRVKHYGPLELLHSKASLEHSF